MIRYGYVLDFLTRLDDSNVSYARAVRRAKLPLLVSDPRDLVAKRPLYRFLDDATRLSGDRLLGLHVGEISTTGGNGTGFVERSCLAGPTVIEGLRAFMSLVSREANEMNCGVIERADGIWPWQHGLTATVQGPLSVEQMELLVLGAVLGLIRRYLGDGWNPPVVWLQNQRCPPGLEQALGGAHIVIGQPIFAVKIPAAQRNQPLLDERFIAISPAGAGHMPSDLIGGLRHALTTSYSDAVAVPVTLELAADFARMGPRTLQRRLAEHGLRFRDLQDQALATSAGRCLLDADVPLAEISHLHGYAEVTHFCRAFRRATGMSPGEFRDQRSGKG